MGLVKVLQHLVNHEHGSPDDQCTLLVVITKTDLSVEEHKIECVRSEIEGVCHRFRDADDVFEVTVFQRIYHAKKEPVPADNTLDAEAAVLANAALGVMRR